MIVDLGDFIGLTFLPFAIMASGVLLGSLLLCVVLAFFYSLIPDERGEA